ncbi:DUF1491 family protein [Lutibaculum baratangense]|uniref:ATP-dependent Zn protease n=1 Tax=Lutibaculum baratangense AMV1 TaxID=631454 RepID=V4T842_9HYPH|nr:DUF1491 family protein [Lutibaculum baratangense]ESR22768.1 hypothetical protein N177_3905 [Lutibaculum baratangense AMV1]
MRVKSGVWVGAYLRRVAAEGMFAVVAKKGAEEAGAIFVKVNRLDGTAELYGPAPQTAFDEGEADDRRWRAIVPTPGAPESEVDGRLERERRFDGDLWIVEIDSREGRHLLDPVVE